MGAELIIAMILAGAVTNAVTQAPARAGEAWAARRQRQQQRAAEREKQARERRRRERAAAWVGRNARRPYHPVGIAYGLGWLVSAAAGATVAGAVGVRNGARTGAREGANVGRRAAREGWGHAAAWREWKRQRDAAEAQRERAAGEPRQAGTSAGGDPPDPPPVWVACRGCGTAITQPRARDADGLCPDCFDPHPTEPGPEPDASEAGGGAQEALVVEDLPRCARCGRPVEGQPVLTDDGEPLCPDCQHAPTNPPALNDADDGDDGSKGGAGGAGGEQCPRCAATTAAGPIYPHCVDSEPEHEEHGTREETPPVSTDTQVNESALASGHEGGEMGIEDTRVIYRKIAAQGQTMGELIDRLATALSQYGASADDITDAQQVAEAAQTLITAAETARENHDNRNVMTEEAAVSEPEAVSNTDYHRAGK